MIFDIESGIANVDDVDSLAICDYETSLCAISLDGSEVEAIY